MTSFSAPETYLDSYGFTHDPFAARVPGFKFFPAQRKPVLGQLHHLARYSQLLLVVTGPQGSGKSLLRQALAASSNKQSVQCVVVTPGVGQEDATGQIARALGASGSSPASIMAQVGQATLNGQEIYLLVDDAERVDDQALRLLLSMAAGGPEGRAHVFLFGGAELVVRFEALEVDSESFHVIELQPYTQSETRAYLAQRIEGAGGDPQCLSDDQVERIHELSGGWPGGINRVAREELIAACEVEESSGTKKRPPLSLPWKHIVGAVVVLAGIALAFVLQGPAEDVRQPQTTTLALEPLPVQASPEPSAQSPLAPPMAEPRPVMREPLAASTAVEPVAPVMEEGLAQRSGTAAAPRVEPGVSSSMAPPSQAANAEPTPTPTPTPRPAAPVTPAPPAAAPKVSAPAPAPAPSGSVASAPAAGNWYLAQPGGNYVLQVLGTRSEQTAQAILRQHGSAYRYYMKSHEGRPLYVVTYGSFPSQQAARAAVRDLPASLQQGSPWARSLASVQQEIKQGR